MVTTFREASESDLEALQALYGALDTGRGAPPIELLRAVLQEIREHPRYAVYLALVGDEVVGTFALAILPTLGDRCAPEGIVEDVVVARDARGRGIGREMMEYAMRLCREAGCYKMVLSSNVRRTDAHRFYEGLGFQRHGYSFSVDL